MSRKCSTHGDVTFVKDKPVVCPLLENTFITVQSPVRITKPSVRKQFAFERSYNIPFSILNR